MALLRVGSIMTALLVAAGPAAALPLPGGGGGGDRPPPPAIRLDFRPNDDAVPAAARDYERIWLAEGPRMVRVMEAVSGLSFAATLDRRAALHVEIVARADCAGDRDDVLQLPDGRSDDARKAMLTHELGHRLQAGLLGDVADDHVPLYLWLYDVWVQLYGRDFADAQVAAERRRGGAQQKAWDAVGTLTGAQRAARWQAIVDERAPTRRSRGRLWMPMEEQQVMS